MRPLGLGQTLDAAMNLTRRHFKALALVVLAVAVPIAAVTVVINALTTDVYDVSAATSFSTDDDGIVPTSDGAYLAGQVAISLLAGALALLATAGCLKIVADSYLGRSVGARESLRAASQRTPQVVVTALLMLVLIVASVVTIIGPIWLAVSWSFALLVVLVEGTSGRGALGRSYKLVEGRWWKTFGRLFIGSLIVSIGSTLVSVAIVEAVIAVVEPTSSAALIGQGLGQLVGWVVTVPFTAALAAIVYFDLRVRKEGFDLAMLAEGVGSAPPSAAAVAVGGFAPPVAGAAEAPVADDPEPAAPDLGGFLPPVPPDLRDRPG